MSSSSDLNDPWNLKMISTFKLILGPRGLTQQLIPGEPRRDQFSQALVLIHLFRGRQRCSRYLGTRTEAEKEDITICICEWCVYMYIG